MVCVWDRGAVFVLAAANRLCRRIRRGYSLPPVRPVCARSVPPLAAREVSLRAPPQPRARAARLAPPGDDAQSIAKSLRLRKQATRIFRMSVNRPNLFLEVRDKLDRKHCLKEIAEILLKGPDAVVLA